MSIILVHVQHLRLIFSTFFPTFNNRSWLFDLCRGTDQQAVSVRTLVKSIACSKNFFGKSALTNEKETRGWLTSLATELVERVSLDRKAHKRVPTSLTVHVRLLATPPPSHSGGRQSLYTGGGQSKALAPHILTAIQPKDQVGGESNQCTQEREVIDKITDLALASLISSLKPNREWYVSRYYI